MSKERNVYLRYSLHAWLGSGRGPKLNDESSMFLFTSGSRKDAGNLSRRRVGLSYQKVFILMSASFYY